jgi:putative salt-induced outer membrane protein YdiY
MRRAAIVLGVLLTATEARAQTAPATTTTAPAQSTLPPAATLPSKAATTGKTELVRTSFATLTPAEEEEDVYMSELSLAMGGLFSSGNARTVALTAMAKYRLRRFEHQLMAAAATNFARAATPPNTSAETTVENYQGLARYDYFLDNRVSVFAQAVARRDRFQGLDLRLNLDPGVAYHFIETKSQRLVTEAGYDLQYDLRRDEGLNGLERARTLHNARVFLGYENKLYPQVSFISALEHIQNFDDTEVYRSVFDVGLKSTIKEKWAVQGTFTLRYENRPLPGVVQADALASIALVYTMTD